MRTARPVALSKSESFSARKPSPTRSPAGEPDIGREARAQGAVGGGQGDDLGRAQIFGAEDLAADRPFIAEAHILRPDAQDQLAVLQILMDLGHRRRCPPPA